jgi:RNA polymerase sigma-70 factor (ECF subfamily)
MTYTETSTSEVAAAHSRAVNISLVAAIAARTEMQDHVYVKYRPPLMVVFEHRGINPDDAEDLLQRTFEQAIKKIRSQEGLSDPSNLGGYLYRTAKNLASAYWRTDRAHRYDRDSELMSNIRDEGTPIEERLDNDKLASCVRELVQELRAPRDREVLERLYLREESRDAICKSLNLTNKQLAQVLWRAHQRFRAILNKNGASYELSHARNKPKDSSQPWTRTQTTSDIKRK